jgi:3D (Asp-Asp-Asp) domain-containing protein
VARKRTDKANERGNAGRESGPGPRLKLENLATAVVLVVGAYALATWALRIVIEERTETVPVPPPVDAWHSAYMAKGWEIILEEGRPGEKTVRTREKRRLWQVLERTQWDDKVTRKPRVERRMVGAMRRANWINAPSLTRANRMLRVEATAYDPGPHTKSITYAGITKLGWRARRGIVAVDPKVIPLRSLLYVEGYGLAWAGDIGGAIKGERIDVCFNTTAEALEWGRKKARVWVLEGVRRK